MQEQLETEKREPYVEVTVTVGEKIGVGYGSISAEELSDTEASQLGEHVREKLVRVSPDVPSCCIDGRFCVGCMDKAKTEPRPSLAGGALVTAYGAAELIGYFSPNDNSSPAERIASMKRILEAGGVNPGGHCDEKAVANEFNGSKTGCGAADRLPEINARVIQDKDLVDPFVANLLAGTVVNEGPVPYKSMEELQANARDYSSIDMLETLLGKSAHNVEILASDETPTSGHKEMAVVFNYVENTTMDRDALVEETGQQVFVVDMWYIQKLAKAVATGPNAVVQEQQLLQAMVAYQVGTYLTLCDGSQRTITLR